MRSTEVPSTYEAFAAEKKQAFHELIVNTCPNVSVCIEDKEDVSVEYDKYLELIQVKSATSPNTRPLSNHYSDLWKTLCHWIEKTKAYNDYNILKYRYSVSTEHETEIGSIANTFMKAKGHEDAEMAFKMLKQGCQDRTLKIPDNYVISIFDNNNREIVLRIIERFSYEIHRDFIGELRQLFYASGSHSPSINEALFSSMGGWIDAQIAPLTQKGKAANITRRAYHEKIIEESERFRNDPLSPTAVKPSDEELLQETGRRPTYLRQLEIIGLDKSRKLEAAIDYLRSSRQINNWATTLRVAKESFDEYEDALITIWKEASDECSEDETDPERAGRKTYHESKRQARLLQLQGYPTPPFVPHGQLHRLADSPVESPRIGWHPNYIDQLKQHAGGDQCD